MLQFTDVPSVTIDSQALELRPPVAAELVSLVSERITQARKTQWEWRSTPLPQRLQVLRAFRQALAAHGARIASNLRLPFDRDPGVTLAAEIIPLADACRYLEKNTERLLRPQRSKRSDRPFWLTGVDVAIYREPHGVVLILGTWNFPLFLPGVQILQALAAGNAVIYKPGKGAADAASVLERHLLSAGLPAGLLHVLSEEPEFGEAAIQAGVDFVLLTGSAATGRRVLRAAADHLTPCAMELSGCDSVFIGAHADIDRAARCVAYGLRLNQGATCIAPRRMFVNRQVAAAFESRLVHVLNEMTLPLNPDKQSAKHAEELVREALASGARLVFGKISQLEQEGLPTVWPVVLADVTPGMKLLKSDVFAPVLSLINLPDAQIALMGNQECPFALGASVFDREADAQELAAQIDAGCVTINDLIVPTADPRVSFGGRRDSGFGVTRGPDGLLQLTRIKAIVSRRSRWLPHLQPVRPALLSAWLQMAHGDRWGARLLALGRFCQSILSKPATGIERQQRGDRDA